MSAKARWTETIAYTPVQYGSSPSKKVLPSLLNSSDHTREYASPSYPVREYALLGVSSSINEGKFEICGTWPVELIPPRLYAPLVEEDDEVKW